MPSDADIQRMRAAHDRRLPSRATITRKQLTDDGMGGQRETPVAVATGVPARLVNQGAQAVSIFASRINLTGDWRITLPVIHEGVLLHVRLEDDIELYGRHFTVVDCPVGRTWDISRLAGCNEVT